MFNYEKFVAFISLVAVVLLTTGVNRCQESYEFAAQSSVPTGTTTTGVISVTPTSTGTATGTVTPISSGSVTPNQTGTVTAEPTETGEPETEGSSQINGNEFFQISKKAKKASGAAVLGALSQLNDEGPPPADRDTPSPAAGGSQATADTQREMSNWLGKGFNGGNDDGAENDSDGDTFTDIREQQFGTDPADANSYPPIRVTTDLSQRLIGSDDDADGLPNSDEASLGTDPRAIDSDNDGVPDGAEIRSGTDPLKSGSIPVDSDGDGLSDQFERSRGLDWRNMDSDGDALRDDLELSLGTDVMVPDSDGDGISDGKEVSIGSDPTVAEQ